MQNAMAFASGLLTYGTIHLSLYLFTHHAYEIIGSIAFVFCMTETLLGGLGC